MAKEYRVAIIGTGNISRTHVEEYKACDRVKLVACVDISEVNRNKFAEEVGIPAENVFADHKEMLAKVKPDIVSICTWPGSHCDLVLDCVAGGVKAITCEKPLAPTLEEGARMVAACDAAGVTLSTHHQLRCHPLYATAAKLLRDGAVGQVERIHGICTPGFLIDNGTHTVDLIRYLMQDQPVRWSMGQISRDNTPDRFGQPGEDWAIGFFEFESGVRTFVESGRLNKGDGYHHIIIYGTEGTLELNKPGQPRIRLKRDGAWEEQPLIDSHNHAQELIAALEEGRPHRSSGKQGLLTHEVLMSIYDSVRRRSIVTLPLENRGNPFNEMIAAGEI